MDLESQTVARPNGKYACESVSTFGRVTADVCTCHRHFRQHFDILALLSRVLTFSERRGVDKLTCSLSVRQAIGPQIL